MITQIYGKTGTGKTSFATADAIQYMTGLPRFEDIYNCKRTVEILNASGYNLTVPDHLVFANWHIQCPFTKVVSYLTNGFYVGMPGLKDTQPVLFHPPGSRLYIDEAQEVYNSRKQLPAFVSRYFEKHRHFDLNITLVSQRDQLIDLNIRDIAQRFILIHEMKHEYNRVGLLVRTIWKYYEFDDNAAVEKFNNSGDKKFVAAEGEQIFNGDIFNYYNTKGCFPMFLKFMENRDFDLRPSAAAGMDLKSIIEFNQLHDLRIPEGFYEKSK